MRTLLVLAFGFEALIGVQYLAAFLPRAPGYDATVWLMTLVRAAVTLGQGMTAMLLVRRAEPAARLGRVVVLTSAVVLTLEIGVRLAPSNLPPGTRSLVLAFDWAWALAVFWALGRIPGNRVS